MDKYMNKLCLFLTVFLFGTVVLAQDEVSSVVTEQEIVSDSVLMQEDSGAFVEAVASEPEAVVLDAVSIEQIKEEADSAYAQEDYDRAIAGYQQLLRSGEHAALYYNLGNCYYRKEDIAHAVLYFEKARLLDPGDADIRFNLDLARSKTIDKIVPEREMFFITWYRAVADWMSVDEWATLAVVSFVLLLLALVLYLFGSRVVLKKTGFFSACLFLLLVLLSNLFAFQQKNKLEDRRGAVVMDGSVTVKSTPNESGTDLFVLHEGTYVEITDDTMKGWKEIRLADGKVGWIQTETIERI